MEQYKNEKGQLHRGNDLPVIEHRDGGKEWWSNGRRYRDNDLPVIVYANGDKWWCVGGKFGRKNLTPTIEYADGKKEWKLKKKYMSEFQLNVDIAMEKVFDELLSKIKIIDVGVLLSKIKL